MENAAIRSPKKTRPLRYAVGMFGTSIPINMFKTYAAYFYIDRLGLITTPQYSLVLFLYTFLDAIDNPVYGFLSDRTRTKWGRRRPWLLIGAPLLVLCFIMFFQPPASLAPGSAFYYFLLIYMMTGTLDSLINANYGALFPELFRTEHERARTNAMRQVFQFIAMIISVALTPVVTDAIGYTTTAYLYGAISIVVIWFMTLGCHEDPAAMELPKPRLFGSILSIASNPKFWIYGVTNATFFGGLALVQSGVSFYAKYHLKVDGIGATVLLGVVILSAIAFIPVWVKIMGRITLMPAWRLSLLVSAVSVLPLYFTRSLPAAAVCVVLFGFGLAGSSATMDIVSARIMDEDARKSGIRREGTYSSLMGILNKANGLLSSLAFLLVFHLFGFENSSNPGSDPGAAARFLTILFPTAVFVLCVIVSRFLKFEQDAPQNKKEA